MQKRNRGNETRRLKNGAKPLDLSTLPRCQGISETTGEPCNRAAVKGGNYCGIHSSRYRPGAVKENQNALKSGRFTKLALQEIAETNKILRLLNSLLQDTNSIAKGYCNG